MISSGANLWPRSVSVGEVTYPPGGQLGPRQQHDVQLVLVHEGSMSVTVDEDTRPTQHAGSVSLLLPGHTETFAFDTVSPTRHSWIQANVPDIPEELEERLTRLPPALPTSTSMAALARETLAVAAASSTLAPAGPEPLVAASSTLAATAHDPLAAASRPSGPDHLAAASPPHPLLQALVTATFWRYITEAERGIDPRSTLAETAREHLHAGLHDPDLDLASLARACNVSAAHLVRVFRRETGVSPIAYLWQRRVAVGVDLLANTGLPVGAIAERCGFKTVYHFSRRVKQATGMPPTEVRRRRW